MDGQQQRRKSCGVDNFVEAHSSGSAMHLQPSVQSNSTTTTNNKKRFSLALSLYRSSHHHSINNSAPAPMLTLTPTSCSTNQPKALARFSLGSSFSSPSSRRGSSSTRGRRSFAGSSTTAKHVGLEFGYASAVSGFRSGGRRTVDIADIDVEVEVEEEDYENDDTVVDGFPVFYTRLKDGRLLAVECERPLGLEADTFIQMMTDKQREAIRRFMERERPQEGECYMWVCPLNTTATPTTVLSLKTLENHLIKSGHIRRVKWRHVSVDKASIYRYSLPQITIKFRQRLANCLTRNYRCCILSIWCLVIMLISIGIVLSVIFGSAPYVKNENITEQRRATGTGVAFGGRTPTSYSVLNAANVQIN